MPRSTSVTFDIDSTLADTTHRKHMINTDDREATDWTAYARACADDLATDVVTLTRLLHPLHRIFLVTARPEAAEAETRAWLREHGVAYDALIMRDRDTERLSPTEWKVCAIQAIDRLFPVKLHVDDWFGVGEAVRQRLSIPTMIVRIYAPDVAMAL